eukprot:2044801-Pleurochrysis_carterae.AAC.1
MPSNTTKAIGRIQHTDFNDSQRFQPASCRLARACPRLWGFALLSDDAGPLRCQRAGRHGDEGVRQTARSRRFKYQIGSST